MPTKKTSSKTAPSKEGREPSTLKSFGGGILKFFKLFFDFIIQIITSILKYSAYLLGSVALLIVSLALLSYLLSAAVGLKGNEDWQKYVSQKVKQLVELEESNVETEDVELDETDVKTEDVDEENGE